LSRVQQRPQTRPQALEVVADAIPEEMRMRTQWVCWRYALDEKGMWTKHPYNPRSGRRASHSDLLTWNAFEEVLEAYEAGRYDGVGFVFCSGDPYTGIDLDGCRDPESGEIEPWAAQIVQTFDTYTELSPSGEGIHVIVMGSLPGRGGKRKHIEMYDMRRFFTFTGHVVRGIEARP
jgi:putative DNA primase/helicase